MGQNKSLRDVCAEVPLEWRPTMRYLVFVAATIAIALVAMVLWIWRGEGDVLELAELLILLPVFGVVIWGPVAVLAVVPGRLVFNWVRRMVPRPRIGTAMAAVAVAALSAGGVVGLGGLVFGEMHLFLFLGLTMFGFGVPSAVVAGLWLYAGEARDDV